MIISVFDRIENIVGKGENAGYQHFLLFLQCFQKLSIKAQGSCDKNLKPNKSQNPWIPGDSGMLQALLS